MFFIMLLKFFISGNIFSKHTQELSTDKGVYYIYKNHVYIKNCVSKCVTTKLVTFTITSWIIVSYATFEAQLLVDVDPEKENITKKPTEL